MLESTEGGSCLNPQKEEAAKVHRRRKLPEYTNGGSSQTMMSGHLDKYLRKLLESIEEGSCSSPQKVEAA